MHMSDPTLDTLIAAARAYEALFVRALFAEWASRVADAAQVRPGQRVLDVACGTGILARTLLAKTDRVVGLDPNAGMLAVASELAPQIEWRRGAAESIPFPDRHFDAVVSQFGLMFFRDRHRALQEMFRVTAAGGRLVVAVWNDLASMPAFDAEVRLLERLGGTRAADALRAPFALGDRAGLCSMFRGAEIAAVEIDTRKGTARFPSLRVMVEADLRGWLPVMGVLLTEEQIREILEAAEVELRDYVTPDGQAVFEVQAHVAVASRF